MAYTIFDGHCDTISVLNDTNQSLLKNNCHIDIEKMSKNQHIQFFAAFIDAKNDLLPPFERCMQLINCYYRQIKESLGAIIHCDSVERLTNALERKQTAVLLSIEGGEALEGKLENLLYFYNKGVRMITLCWNYKNEICSGVYAKKDTGLSEFGKKVIKEMNNLGMIIDTSHMSEKSFWDAIEESDSPIVASHSNAFSIRNNKRNLKDEQISAIIKNNGFIGINFYTEFLSDKDCTLDDILAHIEYILALGGENNIGFGSDFDGMSLLPDGIESIKDIEKIPEAMLRIGYSEELVEKITYGNFLRLSKEVLN